MFNKLIEKPFKILSLLGIFYVVITVIIHLFVGFSFSKEFYPFSHIVSYIAEGIALVLCILGFFFYNKHFLYYAGLEILVFSNLYCGIIYTALFLSSILLILLLTEKRVINHKNIIVYGVIEAVKIVMVIPFGVTDFFYYIGLSLFALCTIGCINMLFRHGYNKQDKSSLNLDDLKLSERQKICIKEIVLNNTTIKALSIDHNVSESAIKKDLAHIYKVLGISGKADLKALFLDYKF